MVASARSRWPECTALDSTSSSSVRFRAWSFGEGLGGEEEEVEEAKRRWGVRKGWRRRRGVRSWGLRVRGGGIFLWGGGVLVAVS